MSNIKCSDCKKTIKHDDAKTFAKRKYCTTCYDKVKTEEDERRHLIGVICDIFNIDRPTGMMFTQMKQFKEEGIDYKTTRLTLQYLITVENFQLEIKYGIGIVRHRYMDMIHHYEKMMKDRREVENINYKSSNYKVTVGGRENKIVKEKMIDLNSIVGGDSVE